ncbi:MAG: NAD-dependent epimerase/dehydratase family protein [Deltaproteobacteria bacterium]|nr:NAD-dependent epimerase/dehydratase family protein [Deltaproteobacteria bacterium]
MTVLVTGGTGFVGTAIVEALQRQGSPVRVLARRSSKTEHLQKLGAEIVYGDILDKQSLVDALKGCDTLYHAAALYDFWGLDRRTLMRTECEGTENAMAAALAARTPKVVYTSTALAIGEHKGEVGTESTKHRGYFCSIYEAAKVASENIVMAYVDKGLPVVIVNPASVYGPGDLKPSGRAMLDFVNGKTAGIVRGFNSLVYRDDVGAGHVLAAAKGKIGERYILSGNTVALDAWFKVLCGLTGAPMKPLMPTWFLAMFAASVEMASRFTRRPPVLSWETFRTMAHGFQVDGSKAVRELGVKYTPFEDGLRRTVLWYWEQGLLKNKPACAA